MSAAPMLAVKGLSVHAGGKALVRDVDLRVAAGECLVVMGESGSGKSLLAHAIMGDLAPGLVARGEVSVAGERIDALTQDERRAFWGKRIALLPQEPWLSLDPLMRVESQIAETHALVAGRDWADANSRAAKDLGRLGLSASARQLPFRLSGGMAQRVAIAATMAAEAGLLIADEPTKGLDADACAGVAASLRAQMEQGRAVVVVTHDIGLARALGGRIAVMRNADMVETGDTRNVLSAPRHDYTKMFVAADPAKWPRPVAHTGGAPVLRGESLSAARGAKTLFEAVDVTLACGEIACVQGPSGGGKTTLGAVLLGLCRRSVAWCAARTAWKRGAIRNSIKIRSQPSPRIRACAWRWTMSFAYTAANGRLSRRSWRGCRCRSTCSIGRPAKSRAASCSAWRSRGR